MTRTRDGARTVTLSPRQVGALVCDAHRDEFAAWTYDTPRAMETFEQHRANLEEGHGPPIADEMNA